MITGYVLTDNEGDFFNYKVGDGYIELKKCTIGNAMYFIDFKQARDEVEWINQVKREARLKHIDIPFPIKVEALYE